MRIPCRAAIYLPPTAVVLCLWLFVGVVTADRFEDGTRRDFFLKKSPTFQVFFRDPYRSDPKGEEWEYARRTDKNGDWLPGSPELNAFLEYCRFRFGIRHDNALVARNSCKASATKEIQ